MVGEAGASIGRSKGNEIQLDASSVSKRHASIVFARGSF
jgi:pSer/pThr/pTyr-binding forkhead associated (FHA) protein